MDIKITDKALRYFLDTPSTPEELARKVSLCGPTFDRINKIDNEYLYEIEVITNRIDTAGAQGVARDSAAILNQMGIKSTMINDPYQEKINLYPHLPKTFLFDITDKTLVPRLVAVSLENITIKDSPEDTKTLLNLCGERPINNVVDITNELTLLYGMPSHIFDLDKLAAQKLTIRESRKGETITTLDGQKNELPGGDIIIEDGAGRIVDLYCIMGGSVAEVDQHTKNILLIVPTGQPKKIRRTSLSLQKRTLAAQIHEKQPDTQLCLPVLTKAIQLFEQRAGAHVSSSVYDSQSEPLTPKEIDLEIAWANKLIGIDIPNQTIITILESLGFSITKKSKDILACLVPSWRYYDINIREDLVEEIARIYGYSKLLPVIPCVNLLPEAKNPVLIAESQIKNILSDQGFNEIYNSSLLSEDTIVKTGLDVSEHLKLTNALSKDFEFLRISLVPSILQNLKNNQGKSEEPYNLFEISNTYQKTKEKLPDEVSTLVIASTLDYRIVKGYLELLLSKLNINLFKFRVTSNSPKYFVTENTAEIISKGKVLGYLGSIKPAILHKIGITSNPIVIEMITESIAVSRQVNLVYKPISEFPEVVEQITVSSKLKIGDIIDKIYGSSKLINSLAYTDSYENNHSFKVTFSSPEKNLTQAEVNEIKKAIQTNFN
jgi:phenylalanyl-tRNA synthetase beta chain